jgi:regulator of protease activity HflC (stomatin/prohibitin superfamily)
MTTRSISSLYLKGMVISFEVILFLILLAIFISGFRIAREYQRAVVFRLGRYNSLRGPGLFWLIPLGIENETRIDRRVITNPLSSRKPSPEIASP